MKIHEAVQKALEVGGYIRRKTWNHPFASKVLPTNTPECCIIMRWDGKNPCRGWQPTAEDLMAEDWTIITDDPSAKPDFNEFEQPHIRLE